MLHGEGFYAGSFYERECRHQRIVNKKCAETLVAAGELAETIGHDGEVDAYRAARLVKALIARAHDEAFGRTLGVIPPIATSRSQHEGASS
ncbi:hypothetical protein O6V14_04800 [Sphingomonas faeni]